MAKKPKIPSTPALRWLKQHRIAHDVQPYEYVPRGGTAASSEALGAPEHQVIKTLVFEDEKAHPLIVLMHGDRSVSAKALARQLGCKSVQPCKPEVAQRHTGYQVGGTSPFGTRKAMPVYIEHTIAALDHIWINGGARGLLVRLVPSDIVGPLEATPVEVAR